MKKFTYVLVFITIVLIFSTAGAVEENDKLTIEDMQNIAVENSMQNAVDDLEIKACESELAYAEKEARARGKWIGKNRDETYNYRLIGRVNPFEAETALEAAKKTKEDNMESLKLDIYKAVHDFLLTEKELEMERKKLGILEEKCEITHARYENSLVTPDDMRNAEYEVESKKVDISIVEESLEEANLELKRLMNLDLEDTLFELQADLAYIREKDTNIDEVVQQAIENDTGVYEKSRALEARQKIMEISEELYKTGDTTYDDNNLNLETARVDYEEAKINVEINVRNKYNDLLTAWDKLQLAKKFESLTKKKLDTGKEKFDRGILSREEYISLEESYLDAVYQKYAAIHDYNIVKAEFQNMVGDN